MEISAATGTLRAGKGEVVAYGLHVGVNVQGLTEANCGLVILAEGHMAKPLTGKGCKVIAISR